MEGKKKEKRIERDITEKVTEMADNVRERSSKGSKEQIEGSYKACSTGCCCKSCHARKVSLLPLHSSPFSSLQPMQAGFVCAFSKTSQASSDRGIQKAATDLQIS